MIRIFIYKNKIINVDNTVDAENLLKKDAWEMPERDVQAVFGDKASMACNQYCTFTKTETGYDVTFTPPQKDIEQLKQQKLHEAERLLSQKLNMLSAYPQAESASFEVQEREATVYLANTEIAKTEIPVITGIAAGAQVDLTDLAQKIVENANSFAPLRGLYLGRHKRVRDLLNKAETPEEVEAVDVEAIFEEEMQGAQ